MLARCFLAFAVLATPLAARDFSDPTWPCIQRKVERLSYGIVWPEVIEEAELSPEAEALARRLALRRLSLDEAEADVAAFAETGPAPEVYGQVFLKAFTRMDRDRSRLIKGIERSSLSQIGLSEKITEIRAEMDSIMDSDSPDYDRVDMLEETLDWNERIFRDRQGMLTYVCESPVLLEKRIYAIGQLLLAARR